MSRAFAMVVFLTGATVAYSNETLTVASDDQAILVNEGQLSPWLHAEVREGKAQQGAGDESRAYAYVHLDKPINFAASSGNDHFSQNAYHVYDLSFSSDNAELSSRLESLIGRSVSLRGLVKASPTGKSPTELHIVVTSVRASADTQPASRSPF